MLTDQDITKLMQVFMTKQEQQNTEALLKKEITDLRNDMLDSLDRIMKGIDDLRTENAAGAMRFARHETWIRHLADEVEAELPGQ